MDMARIVDEAADELEGIRKAIRAGLDDVKAPGLVEPTDAEFMEWVQSMAGEGDPMAIPPAEPGKYPPIPMIDPDGAPVVISPWIAMLDAKVQPPSPNAGKPLVDGGAEILARMERIERKLVSDAVR